LPTNKVTNKTKCGPLGSAGQQALWRHNVQPRGLPYHLGIVG
jgi:hypothetical protein